MEIHCPDVIRKEGDMQLLGCVNVLPYGDRLIYNFPASSKVYVYDLSVKKSKEYDFPSTFTDPFFHLPDINGSEPGFGCLKTVIISHCVTMPIIMCSGVFNRGL